MKNISAKTDGTSSLPAASFNSMVDELENFVLDAGLTLDAGSETTADPNPTQTSQALYMAGRDADAFTDSGSANAYALTKIRGKAETAYRNGARFRFVPANTNTGASTVNIQSIGAKNIRFSDNSALTAGAITSGVECTLVYDLSADNFKLHYRNNLVNAATPGLQRGYSSLAKIRLQGANGYGSTNNKIRRFNTVVVNTGTGLTYADSATLGATFTCTEDGIYSFSYSDNFSASGARFGISLNSSQLTTDIVSITAADCLVYAVVPSIGGASEVSITLALSSGDVIRAHTEGISASDSAAPKVTFTAQRIS